MAKDYVEDMECDAKFPIDYTWHSVNNFVFNSDVAFEDLQALCLGLAAKLEAAQHHMHLTGGESAANQALPTPEVSSAPKQNPIPPTRK